MGMRLFGSSAGDVFVLGSGNPDPKNFKVVEYFTFDRFNFAVKVNYPDAKNYEGDKILVYLNTPIDKVLKAHTLDPHFNNDGSPSPIARFEPTEFGWELAKSLVHHLTTISP